MCELWSTAQLSSRFLRLEREVWSFGILGVFKASRQIQPLEGVAVECRRRSHPFDAQEGAPVLFVRLLSPSPPPSPNAIRHWWPIICEQVCAVAPCGKELLEKEAHVDDRLGAGAGAMPSTKQCVPSVQVFNITASVPRRAWAATLSLDALALERQPVIVTGLPVIQHWPALTAWSDLCAHAPHLGRVFSGTGRVFYHDNREKPFAMHQA